MMTSSGVPERPIRVGVFSTVEGADHAVHKLLEAGFSKEQISVLCSDPAKERLFGDYEHEEPAGAYTLAAVTTGGAIGAALGGMAALAGVVATGGVALLAAGGLATWAGGVVGGLVGAMMTRGVERELADYYDQAVVEGKLLVAAEVDRQHSGPSLELAAKILEEAGAEPVSLRPG
jgi:hypothetical protein